MDVNQDVRKQDWTNMMNNGMFPKVSVVVPVWNPGPGISRCVESLRGQTLEDIEMIFVDDCGTDGAMDIVRAAAAEDSRIRIITNERNLGAGASRNAAIELALGEYLAFVDADDYIAPNFLETLYEKGNTENLDIVKGRIVRECEDGTIVKSAFKMNDAILKGMAQKAPLFCFFRFEFQSALYHKKLFVNSNIQFGLTSVAEDTTFLLKVCHVAKHLGIDERVAYHYVFRMSSALNSFSEASLEARLSALRDETEYLSNHVEPNPYAFRYITLRLKQYLSLHEHVAKVGMEKEAVYFLSGLREIAKEYPNIGDVKDMSIIALVEYGVGLAERPYHSPWEVAKPEDYLEVVVNRAKFLMAHPKYYKEWSKLASLSERFVKRMEAEGIPTERTKWFRKRVKAMWYRPSVMWMRFRNYILAHQSVCDVKRIPLVKSLGAFLRKAILGICRKK